MSSRPLNLAILWHMHQPFYKDLVTNEFILPWVRLHAIKDYYDMLVVLDKFPEVKVNFNLVPSLLLQIEDYADPKNSDQCLSLTLKDPGELTLSERVFILRNFFMANWEIMIRPYPRYWDLLMKRGRFVSPAELKKVAERFSKQELLDLQVWFNLAWFGFIYKSEDQTIIDLINKGKYFSHEDKLAVVLKQKEVMAKIIPAYRAAQDRGQVELSVSPFYHPILPLLCDSNSAREAMPDIRLPNVPFRHPEDAEAQIRLAVEYYQGRFGKQPAGMWPSEGSVSEQIIPLLSKAGIKWIGTDEGILLQSLNKMGRHRTSLPAEEIYQPYLAEHDGAEVSMVFRNHFISDQVGFVYYRWKVGDAVADFMGHLNNIRLSLPEDGKEYLVTVILDGENAWEYYPNQGQQFLAAFYDGLRCNPMVRTVKIGDYLSANPPTKRLSRLFAGSWIDNNFKIWIGHEEDNSAWNYLNEARLVLHDANVDKTSLAWQEFYIAEGSDWFWWYGDDHSSDNDAEFDLLFRKHLKNVYQLLGRPSPSYLEMPIKKIHKIRPVREPAYLIEPVLDGEITNYYEWLAAGHFDIAKANGAMHQFETILNQLYFGFSLKNLYFRLDLGLPAYNPEMQVLAYVFILRNDSRHLHVQAEISFSLPAKQYVFKVKNLADGAEKELQLFAVGRIIEAAIPFADLAAQPGDSIEFSVSILKHGEELERWPRDSMLNVVVPSENYALEQWFV
ncbi:MAG: glycoside hydrolase family 57 protein [Candidatus Margulisiibacteriota bacterium]